MKFRQSGKARKKCLPYWATGTTRLLAVSVRGRQYLLQQSIWNPVVYLGWNPIWGEPLTAGELFRFLFPGERFPMQRPTSAPRTTPLYAAPVDDLLDGLKLLADHLALTAFEGEGPGSRLVSSLLIFADDGVWKAMLKDKNAGKCLWIASPSLLDIFAVMDESLGSPNAIWRDDRHAGHETARRNKPNKTS